MEMKTTLVLAGAYLNRRRVSEMSLYEVMLLVVVLFSWPPAKISLARGQDGSTRVSERGQATNGRHCTTIHKR